MPGVSLGRSKARLFAGELTFQGQKTVLHEANVEKISAMGRAAKNARAVFDYLEKSPIIDIGKTAGELNLAFSMVSHAVNKLVEAGILIQTNNASRNRVFAYEEYLAILRKDT